MFTCIFHSDDKEGEMKEFFRSIKSRLTVAQVVEGVKSNARLTFDYVSLVILARYENNMNKVIHSMR